MVLLFWCISQSIKMIFNDFQFFFVLFAQSIILKGNTFCFAELNDDNMSLRHIKRAQLSLWYNEMKGHKDHIVKQILLLSNINCP